MKNRSLVLIISFIILAFIAIGLSVASPVIAGEQPTDDDVNAIAKQLYCPVCENIPLDTCGTQACEQWRELIRLKLSEGWTEEEIKNYFVNQYGDRVLAEPPRRGLNWLVYVVPPLAFLAGIYMIVNGFRQWSSAGKTSMTIETAESEPDVTEDDYVQQMESLLKDRETD